MSEKRPRRYIITGGPAVGKAALFDELRKADYKCSRGEIAREIYREFKSRLGRHLEVGDRREYSLEVLRAFIAEYCAHKEGLYFYNRGIPDGFGWERFFGLGPSPELIEATHAYRYDGVFILDSLTKFDDEKDVVWTSDREAARVHQLLIQGYIDAGYSPIFVPVDFVERRVKFILANL